MQLVELRKELKFNRELLSLVETLKNVAGAQYHVLEKKKKRFLQFMESFAGFFRVVDLMDARHVLLQGGGAPDAVLMVTSDSGFMGGLNTQVLNEGMAIIRDSRNPVCLVIGEKGAGVLQDRGGDYIAYPGVHQDSIHVSAREVRETIVSLFEEGRIGRLFVAYPRALSFSTQEVQVVRLLPCGELFEPEGGGELEPFVSKLPLVSQSRKVVVESELDQMAGYLAGTWIEAKLFEIFEDSKLAEFSARAMHLEDSLQKVQKEHKKIRQKVFKASHELIDKGMRESFAAKSTKGKKRTAPALAGAIE
jgi:F0F1-type ATP synthase gamma subunit